MLTKHFTVLAVLLCLLAAKPAEAAITAEGAQKVKSIVETIIRSGQKGDPAVGHLASEGEIIVEQADQYYAVTLPQLNYVYPDESRIDVGILALNVAPDAAPGKWKVTMAIPTPIKYLSADGTPLSQIQIGRQSFTGIWDENLKSFATIQADYGNVSFKSLTGPDQITVTAASLMTNLEKGAGNKWSGPFKLTLNGVSARYGMEANAAPLTLGKIMLSANIKGYDTAAYNAYEEKLAAIAEAQSMSAVPALSRTHELAYYNLVTEAITSLWDSIALEISLETLNAPSVPPAAGLPYQSVRADSAGMQLTLDGLRTESVAATLQAGFSAFSPVPKNGVDDLTLPANYAGQISLNNLPVRKLIHLGSQYLTQLNNARTPAQIDTAGLQSVMMVPQLLTESGANVNLFQNFSNQTYKTVMNGNFVSDLSAVQGLTGKMDTEISGIDELVAKLGQKGTAGTPPEQQAAQAMLPSLTVLQIAGKQEQNKGGKSVRTYNLVVARDGKVTLNGVDISALGLTLPKPGSFAPVQTPQAAPR